MTAKEVVSAARASTTASRDALAASKVTFVDTVKLTSKLARVTGALAFAGGVNDALDPPHDGARGLADRGFGVTAAVAGGAALVVALSPAWAGVVAGALVISAGWTVGSFVYDHREWMGDRLSDVGKGAGKAWHAVTGLFD
jgi:hypothetical protein